MLWMSAELIVMLCVSVFGSSRMSCRHARKRQIRLLGRSSRATLRSSHDGVIKVRTPEEEQTSHNSALKFENVISSLTLLFMPMPNKEKLPVDKERKKKKSRKEKKIRRERIFGTGSSLLSLERRKKSICV